MISHQTLQASRALLTAGYYREYLGFTEIWRLEKAGMEMIWLSLNGQNLLIESKEPCNLQQKTIEFSIDGIEHYYFRLKNMVTIKRPLTLTPGNNWQFTYYDCEGNNITVTGTLSRKDKPARSDRQISVSCRA